MSSKQRLVRCGLLAMVLMSTCVSAAPSPGLIWPSLASSLASVEATQVYYKVAPPHLDAWAVDWHRRVWLWLSCATPDAVMRCTGDGSDPTYYSYACDGLLIVTGIGTVKVRSFRGP